MQGLRVCDKKFGIQDVGSSVLIIDVLEFPLCSRQVLRFEFRVCWIPNSHVFVVFVVASLIGLGP